MRLTNHKELAMAILGPGKGMKNPFKQGQGPYDRKNSDDEDDGDDAEDGDSDLPLIASDIMDALHNDDAQALADALESFITAAQRPGY